MLKEAFQERMKLAKVVVLDTAGVSSMYANDGGVIVAVEYVKKMCQFQPIRILYFILEKDVL